MAIRFTAHRTSLDVRLDLGPVFYPQLYSFSSGLPICRLVVTPQVQERGLALDWDISLSSPLPGGASLDTYQIAWGGATDIGSLVSQSWTGAQMGQVMYSTAGRKTITAYVTDVLGVRSLACRVMVEIEAAPGDGWRRPVYQQLYIGTTDNGCFVATPNSEPVPANLNLSGDWLKFRSLRLNPVTRTLPLGGHHLVACTAAGLAVSYNGALSWYTWGPELFPEPENIALDDPAPVSADLDFIDVAFDPADPLRVYLLRTTSNRSWVYWSDDYMATWRNRQVRLG